EGVGNQLEVAAVSGIDVNAEPISIAQGEDAIKWIDSAYGGGAEGDHDGADIALLQLGLEGVEVHAAAVIGRDRGVVEFEDGGDALVRVVGLSRSDDAPAGGGLARHPERFKVGDGAAGGEVAEVVGALPAEDLRDVGNGFDLHFGAGAAAVAGVIV